MSNTIFMIGISVLTAALNNPISDKAIYALVFVGLLADIIGRLEVGVWVGRKLK